MASSAHSLRRRSNFGNFSWSHIHISLRKGSRRESLSERKTRARDHRSSSGLSSNRFSQACSWPVFHRHDSSRNKIRLLYSDACGIVSTYGNLRCGDTDAAPSLTISLYPQLTLLRSHPAMDGRSHSGRDGDLRWPRKIHNSSPLALI